MRSEGCSPRAPKRSRPDAECVHVHAARLAAQFGILSAILFPMFTHTHFATAPNPYANFGPGSGGSSGADFDGPIAARTSALAITALILAILCFLPGFGLLALLLGGAAILFISRSQGRLKGLGMAVAACVLGLVVSVVQLFIVVGAVGAANTASAVFGPMLAPAQRALVAMEKKDFTTAKAEFSPVLIAAVTDERMAEFTADYQTTLGNFKSGPQSFMDYLRGWMALGQQMGANNQNVQQQQANGAFPIPAEFDKGWGLIIVQFPPNFAPMPTTPGTAPTPSIENLGIAKSDGTIDWLADPTTLGTGGGGGAGGAGGSGGSGGSGGGTGGSGSGGSPNSDGSDADQPDASKPDASKPDAAPKPASGGAGG